MNNREYDELNKLTNLDDRAVDEISNKYPALDEAALKRIEKLCERKMKMNINMNNTKTASAMNMNENTDRVEGVERIRHIPFYRRPAFAACASVVLVLIAGSTVLMNLSRTGNGDGDGKNPKPPVIATNIATEATTDTTSEATETTAAPEAEAPTENKGITIGDSGTKPAEVHVADDNATATAPADATVVEVTTEAKKTSVTNGYDVADYPAYYDYLNGPAFENSSQTYALYDINNDGTPELITYSELYPNQIRSIHDMDYNGYVRSNYSAYSFLCEGGTVLSFQSDPPYYAEATFIHPLSGGNDDRLEGFVFCGSIDVVNGSFVMTMTDAEEYSNEIYYSIPSESERYNSDSIYDFDRSDDNRITLEQANQILAKYRPLTIETASVSSVR